MKPLVSVIIPTYNRADWVGKAIESALLQSMNDREVIVVDDGSIDNTLETLGYYGNLIRVISRGNGGPAAARNSGIAAAEGTWVAFLDSDDEWMPTTLEVHMEAVTDNPELCVHLVNATVQRGHDGIADLFEIIGFTPYARTVIRRPLSFQLQHGLAWPQCALIRHDALLRVGGFDEKLKSCFGDFDLFCRLAMLGPWGVDIRRLARILRRLSIEKPFSDQWMENRVFAAGAMVQIYEKLSVRADLEDHERNLVDNQLTIHRNNLIMAHLKQGNREAARKVSCASAFGLVERAGRYALTLAPSWLISFIEKKMAFYHLLPKGTLDEECVSR